MQVITNQNYYTYNVIQNVKQKCCINLHQLHIYKIIHCSSTEFGRSHLINLKIFLKKHIDFYINTIKNPYP